MAGAEITTATVDRIRLAVPEAVRALEGWLLWREDSGRKVPFYSTSGTRRHGQQNTAADQRELVVFERAVDGARALYQRGEHFTGFGLALRPDWNLVVIDLDNKGEDHVRQRLHDEVVGLAGNTYVERSPSGRGRHVMLRGNGIADAKIHRDGVEVFANAGYVTTTGLSLNPGAGVEPMPEALRSLLLRRMRAKPNGDDKVHEGGRRLDLISFAGRLVRAGLRGDALVEALHERNRKAYEPPLDEAEMREVIASAKKFEAREPADDALGWLSERIKFIAGVNRYWDTQARQFLERGALDDLLLHRMPVIEGKPIKPSRCLAGRESHKFDAVGYHPGAGAEFHEYGARILNLYRGPEIAAVTDDVTLFTDHLGYLVDDNHEAFGHLRDWLAYLVQRPGEKIAHGILHINPHEGTGRGWLLLAMARVLGEANVITLDEDRLLSRFNDYLLRCQLLTIPELETGESRRAIALRLKPILSDARLRIEQKGLPAFEIANHVNVLASSNRIDATFIGQFDRRWFVIASTAKPRESAYYDALYRWLAEPRMPGALAGYLVGVDLSEFNPGARPEMTPGKAEVIRASAPAVEQYVVAALEEEAGPFERPLVTLLGVLDWLGERGQRGLSAHRLGVILADHGAVNLGKRRVAGGRRVRIWACRELDYWTTANESLIAETFAGWAREDEE